MRPIRCARHAIKPPAYGSYLRICMYISRNRETKRETEREGNREGDKRAHMLRVLLLWGRWWRRRRARGAYDLRRLRRIHELWAASLCITRGPPDPSSTGGLAKAGLGGTYRELGRRGQAIVKEGLGGYSTYFFTVVEGRGLAIFWRF